MAQLIDDVKDGNTVDSHYITLMRKAIRTLEQQTLIEPMEYVGYDGFKTRPRLLHLCPPIRTSNTD